jgi:hypothetical protein
MKKTRLLFLISFLMFAAFTQAQNTLNNPKDKAGHYIVKWDCSKNAFADSNDFESDETFTFAVDVTGTAWEDWLKETPTNAGATRALAINKWTNWGDVSGGTNRLKQVAPNIYAATWNIAQIATAEELITKSVMVDSVVFVYGQVFGFEFTDTNPGAGWWMWPASIPGGTQIDPGAGTGAIFKTVPYTGTKTSPEFYSDDYEGGLFFSNNTPEKGYTLPCATYVAPVDPKALNNPKDKAGHYIVKWDCATSAFADTNDFEADETFTFAVDVTGTAWENWLKETPTAAGATRALAINKWTNWGDVSGGTNRLKEIAPNIFGATWNITQIATSEELKTKSVTVDSVVFVYGQVFGFEFTADNPGANWWMWPEAIPGGTQIDPGAGTGAIFKTIPYTGTKTSEVFYSDEYVGGLFLSNNTPEKGYTVPCGEKIPTAVPDVIGSGAKVIGNEYYNMVGQKLPKEPTTGLYIHKILKADGTSVVIKKFNLEDR